MLHQIRTAIHCPTRALRLLPALLTALSMTVLCPGPGHTAAQDSEILRICTGIAPLAFLLEQIGGDRVHVATLLPEGQDPHLFEPGPRMLHQLSTTQLYLMAGLPFERILVDKIRASNTRMRHVDMSAMVSLLDGGHEHHDCADHDAHGHDHAGIDPHFWLGPLQLHQFISAAARILSETDPAHAAVYERNAASLRVRLENVHAHNLEILAPYRNRIMFVYHPAFGYFAHAYGLQQQAVETGGRQPAARQMTELIRLARDAGVRTVFVQPQFDTKSAQTIAAAINGRVVSLDPLSANVIDNLETIARALAESFEQPGMPGP